jgi:Acetyltransferase (GNAT) domain
VAVDSHLQGKGLGSALMAEYCARLDGANAVGYLETDRAENVKFYRRFGFQTIAEAPVLNIPNWFMQRDSACRGPASGPRIVNSLHRSGNSAPTHREVEQIELPDEDTCDSINPAPMGVR